MMRVLRLGESPPAANGVGEGIAREELAGLAYMFWGRLIALGMLAVWVALTLPFERSGAYLLAIAAFALLGAPPYLLARRGIGGTSVTAAFLLLDAGILTYILIVPPPFFAEGWTPQLNLRLPNFLYLGVFLVGMALSYSPALVIWTGIASIAAWSAGFLWVASLPGSIPHTSEDMLDRGLSSEAVISGFLDLRAVSLTTLFNQIVFLVLITVILALTVWRSRRLVRRQVAAESERAMLSRYFSPNIVRELSTSGRALDRPAVQPVAVLFADMVGFTAISERLAPEALVGLLREFHGRLARVAFAHDGTVDKYIGDAIMVHFGTPRPREDDPVRALACAATMVTEVGRWNAERAKAGEAPIGIGIGVHYGEVLVGNIGDARRLEYTVLGDTVNVASRLEGLTRETGAPLVVSDDLVRAVRGCGVEPRRSPRVCAATRPAPYAAGASQSRSGASRRWRKRQSAPCSKPTILVDVGKESAASRESSCLVFWQLAVTGNRVGERCLIQHLCRGRMGHSKNPADRTARFVMTVFTSAIGHSAQAWQRGDRTIDDADDLPEENQGRRLQQGISAVLAPFAVDDPVVLQGPAYCTAL